MNIQVKIFGPLADVVGSSQLSVDNVNDTDLLMQKIIKDFPKLKSYEFKVAVGTALTTKNTILKSGDVVALLPPFAGG